MAKSLSASDVTVARNGSKAAAEVCYDDIDGAYGDGDGLDDFDFDNWC